MDQLYAVMEYAWEYLTLQIMECKLKILARAQRARYARFIVSVDFHQARRDLRTHTTTAQALDLCLPNQMKHDRLLGRKKYGQTKNIRILYQIAFANIKPGLTGVMRIIAYYSEWLLAAIRSVQFCKLSLRTELDAGSTLAKFSLDNLPPELILEVSQHLDDVGMRCLRDVCSVTRQLFKNHYMVPTLSEKRQLEDIAREDLFRTMIAIEHNSRATRPHNMQTRIQAGRLDSYPPTLHFHNEWPHPEQQRRSIENHRCCSACQDVHDVRYFRPAELLKYPEKRKCRGAEAELKICPHLSYTFNDIFDKFRDGKRSRDCGFTLDSPRCHKPTCKSNFESDLFVNLLGAALHKTIEVTTFAPEEIPPNDLHFVYPSVALCPHLKSDDLYVRDSYNAESVTDCFLNYNLPDMLRCVKDGCPLKFWFDVDGSHNPNRTWDYKLTLISTYEILGRHTRRVSPAITSAKWLMAVVPEDELDALQLWDRAAGTR